MKSVLVTFFLAIFILIAGCSDSIVDPNQNSPEPVKVEAAQKISLLGKGTGIVGSGLNLVDNLLDDALGQSLVKLPLLTRLLHANDLTKSETINGRYGGTIRLNVKSGTFKLNAVLVIPPHAFSGVKKITMAFDPKVAVVNFSPSPYSFDKPLDFSVDYQGLNLKGKENNAEEDSFDFYYITNDGQLESVVYKNKKVDKNEGELKVDDVELNHFSSYGWTRLR
jgi:hypothetical protein